MSTKLRSLASSCVAVALLFATSSCSGDAGSTPASTDASSPQSMISQAPSVNPSQLGGVTLTSLGIQNGPADFRVPEGLEFRQRIDQSNVVTLVVPGAQGQELYDFLHSGLSSMGFTITAASSDSLIFEAPGWEGAFTMDEGIAGLTLRRLAPPNPTAS